MLMREYALQFGKKVLEELGEPKSYFDFKKKRTIKKLEETIKKLESLDEEDIKNYFEISEKMDFLLKEAGTSTDWTYALATSSVKYAKSIKKYFEPEKNDKNIKDYENAITKIWKISQDKEEVKSLKEYLFNPENDFSSKLNYFVDVFETKYDWNSILYSMSALSLTM